MLTEEAKRYLDYIKEKPYKIGHLLGFNDLTKLHNDWIKMFLRSKQDETLLAHRGSYKTTCLSLAIALQMIMYPNKNIIFVRKTDDDITEVIYQVKKILDSNIIRTFVLKIYNNNLAIIKSNSSEITTNLMTANKGAPQLLGIGIKGSLTGKHADIVITDDIVNLKDRISKAEREFTKNVYMELQNIKNRNGRIINTGTTWHKEDAISLMPNIQIHDCYSTGLLTREQIEEIRNKMTPSLFSANYELKHIADGNIIFTNPQFTSEDKFLYNGSCHIDARYTGEDGTAFTIVNKIGDFYYVLGKRREAHIDSCIDEFLLIKDKYRGGSISCENNADKGYLEKDLRNRGQHVNGYHESMNKYIKITTYLKKVWKNIVFHEDTDPDYINEILEYNEQASHDDSPDSLSSIIRQLEEPVSVSIGYTVPQFWKGR